MYARAARQGAAGAISGTATVLPELMVAIDRRARSGADTVKLEASLAEFLNRANAFPFPVGFREAIAARGLKVGPHASPLGPQESLQLEEFRLWFKAWMQEGFD